MNILEICWNICKQLGVLACTPEKIHVLWGTVHFVWSMYYGVCTGTLKYMQILQSTHKHLKTLQHI
jgi:hypothetical protein